MKVQAVRDKRVNRVGPIGSAVTEYLTISKAADAVTTPAIVSLCGWEDNASVLTAFSVVGELDVIADTVDAPGTQTIVENIVIFNCDTTTHVFTANFDSLTGDIFTVTIKPGDIWSWKDGYEETSAFDETNQ